MKEKIEFLSNELDKLNDLFNNTEKTIVEIEKNGTKDKDISFKITQIESDFANNRMVLNNIINNGNNIINNISNIITIDPTDTKTLLAFNTISDSINKAMELLNKMYFSVIDLKLKLELKNNDVKEETKQFYTISEVTKLIAKNKGENDG